MQRSLPILLALGIAAFGATASAQTIQDNDKSRVAVDASRDNNQDNDKITTTISKTSMSRTAKVEDSFQNNSKTTTDSHNRQDNDTTYKSTYRDDSTKLTNVGNGLSKPVATNALEATVCGNRVLNVAKAGSAAGNVRIDGSLNGFKGISSLNSNAGANSIQQSSVSVAAVSNRSF